MGFLPCRLSPCLRTMVTYSLCKWAPSPEKEKRKEFRNAFPAPPFKRTLRRNREGEQRKSKNIMLHMAITSYGWKYQPWWKYHSPLTDQLFFQPQSRFLEEEFTLKPTITVQLCFLKMMTWMKHPYFKNTSILQNIWLSHVSSPFLQCFLLEVIYSANYKTIHQPESRKTIVEEQLEIERWSHGWFPGHCQCYETLCRMAYFFFLPQPGLLLSVPESTGKSPPKVRKTIWTHPGCSQNKLLIITDVAPKGVPS